MKKKKSHKAFSVANLILGVAIVIVVLVFVIAFACPVEHTQVEGSTIYPDDVIEQVVLQEKYGKNAVTATVMNLIRPKKDIPFVQSVKIKMTSRNALRIVIEEKQMVGYLPLAEGKVAYFNDDGLVVEVSDYVLDGISPVYGLVLDQAQVGERLPIDEDKLDFMAALFKALTKYHIPIQACAFDEEGRIFVSHDAILISIGNYDYLEEKMMRLPQILPNIEGQAGILHLENWSEENTDIVFERQIQ